MRNWIHLCAREGWIRMNIQFLNLPREHTRSIWRERSVKECRLEVRFWKRVRRQPIRKRAFARACVRAISHPRFDNALAGTDKQLRSSFRTCSDICLQTSRFHIASGYPGGFGGVLLIKRHLVWKHPGIDLLVCLCMCGCWWSLFRRWILGDTVYWLYLSRFGNWRIFKAIPPILSDFFFKPNSENYLFQYGVISKGSYIRNTNVDFRNKRYIGILVSRLANKLIAYAQRGKCTRKGNGTKFPRPPIPSQYFSSDRILESR